MIKKREIDKFPYGVSEGLSDNEAKENMYKAGKGLLKVIKIYGPTVLRIALIVYLLPESALADGTPSSSPSPNPTPGNQAAPAPQPTTVNLLPAGKELLGIGAVALTCAAAASNPVTFMGIGACLIVVLAKAAGKL